MKPKRKSVPRPPGVPRTSASGWASVTLRSSLPVKTPCLATPAWKAVERVLVSRSAASSAEWLVAAVAKHGVITGKDDLRVTLAQPLALVRGTMEFEQVAVVDRNTGEIGTVTERFDVSHQGPRRLVAEGLYRTSMLGGSSEFSLFARAELRPSANLDDATPNLMTGARFRIPF